MFQKICFPGYVFIESDKSAIEFILCSYPVIHKQKDIYRFLCYRDKNGIAMRDEEQVALSKIFGKNNQVDVSVGLKENGSVKIISGASLGNEDKIVRFNDGRNEAVILIEMFGSTVPALIELEVI